MKTCVERIVYSLCLTCVIIRFTQCLSRVEKFHEETPSDDGNDIRERRTMLDLFLKQDRKYESCDNDRKPTNINTDKLNVPLFSGKKMVDASSDDSITTDNEDDVDIVDAEDVGINENSKPTFKRKLSSPEVETSETEPSESKEDELFNTTSRKRIKLPTLDRITLGKSVELTLPGDIESNVTVLSVSPLVIEVDNFIDDEEVDLFLSITRAKQPKIIQQLIDPVKVKHAKQTFSEWDYNEDGAVTADEVILLPGLADIKFTVEDADDMFFMLKMDKNGDKRVTFDEMKKTDFGKLKKYLAMLKAQQSRKRDLNSRGAWVWHDEDELLKFKEYGYFEQFHERISAITDIPADIIKESESIKVKHYGPDQFQTVQQDSQPVKHHVPCCMYGDKSEKCRHCRYLSYAIFLSDVEEGGEIAFPMANHKFQDIMNNSGNWRGYYVYSKTTGHKYYFQVEMKFEVEGENKVFSGDGNEDQTRFSFLDGIVIDNYVTFEKNYNNGDKNMIKYQGKIIESTRIVGNWWVPGNKRYRGTFYMWNRDYEIYSNRVIDESNRRQTCPQSKLVVKPSKGKALFWYNHHLDPLTGMVGELHQEAMTSHCEVVTGDKWVATSWVNIIGDGDLELKAWRRGYNLLHGKSNVYEVLGTSEPKLDHEPYEDEFLADIETKNMTAAGEIPGYYKHKPPSNALQALNLLFHEMSVDQLKLLANTVESKLGLQCIPLVAKHKGKVHVIDGSRE